MKLKEELLIFWMTFGFYFLLFFNSNNKTFVLFFFFYLFCLHVFLKNFKVSLLLAYLASWPFSIGKTYVFEFVSALQLNLPYHPYGLGPVIIISVKEIFIMIMLFVLIRDFFLKKGTIFRVDIISILLFLFLFSQVLASLLGSINPEISLVISLFSISPLILYWYIRNLKVGKKGLFPNLLAVFSAIIVLEAVLASLQFIKRNLVGLSIEAIQSLPLDLSLEAVVSDYRPAGTFVHPNNLADFLLIYLFIFLPALFSSFKSYGKIRLISFLAGFWTFLLTLSRSAWISFFISLIVFLFVVEKKWQVRLVLKKEAVRLLIFSVVIVLPFFIFFFLPRLINTFYAFEIYGGGYTRIELLKESWEIIRQFPLFGIGLGMDTYYFYQTALLQERSIFSGFPESVHNGYLSLWLQAGIFSLVIFLLSSFLFLKNLANKIYVGKNILNKIIVLSLVCGLLGIYLNSLWQGFWPDLQTVVFLGIIYAGEST